MTTVSVAMCTFNGARFLLDQLDSIATQSRPPDEVVVCDDGSTDGTPALVEEFASTAPFPVRFHPNRAQLGVSANFSRAISLCRGSVIALSDQDDVWVPRKLETMVAVLEDRPEVGAVFSDADLVDEALRPLGRTLFDLTGFTPARRRRFRDGRALQVLLSRPVVCGATMAIRASYRDLLLPIPSTGLHDLWLSTLLGAVSTVVALDDPLIRYRQHDSNQIGSPGTSARARLARRRARGVFGDELSHYRAMAERLGQAGALADGGASIELLDAKVRHLDFRRTLPARRLRPILTQLGTLQYHRYSRGVESAVFDLVFRGTARGSLERTVV